MWKKKNNTPHLSVLLSEFNRSLMLIVDKSLLVSNFIAKVNQIIPVRSVHVFLLDENTGKYKLYRPSPGHPVPDEAVALDGRDKLIRWLSVNDRELVLSRNGDIVDYLDRHERDLLRGMGAELVYPLKVMNHISGTIFLGEKCDGTRFSDQEITLLSLLFDQSAIAIEYASQYEKQNDRIKRMYRADRLAILGELAAGAAHEIRNPLTTIRSTIQFLSKDFRDDPVKSEMAGELIAEVERINKIVQGMLSFARPSELDIAEVDIRELVEQTLILARNTLERQGIQVRFNCLTDHTVNLADREQMKQVFLNIVLNAAEAMGGTSEKANTLTVGFEQGSSPDGVGSFLLVSFADTGPGIREEELEKIFNPFFTTKEDGTGLGLAISYGVVHRHDGEIEVKSTPGQGTVFTIKLPQKK